MKLPGNVFPKYLRGSGMFLVLFVTAVLFAAGSSMAGIPDETCADCHDTEGFHNTPHGTYFGKDSKLMEYGCESCHGSALEHIEEGDPELIINPANQDQFGGDLLCLSCHKGQHMDDWQFSAHNAADVGCTGCHTIHTTEITSVKKSSPELCYDCHSTVRAASYMLSHHPIAEGKLDCQDCHNVHGGFTPFVQDFSKNELCFSCHAEKEGPFVYEHSPVVEDCMMCHSAHGSVANNLLKQNEPALCLNCHSMHFHATVTGTDQEFAPNANLEREMVSTRDAFKKGMLTKCTQCHNQVHGSDMPSQTISTGGNALTR